MPTAAPVPPPAQEPPPERARTLASLASSMRFAVGLLSRRIRNERQDEALSLNQLSALGTLVRHGPLPVGELASHERVRPPSMTRTVTSLEELGLVVREPHPVDRRLSIVRITEAGLGRIDADRKRRDAWLAHRLRELSPAERQTLRAALPILEKLARS